MSQTAADGIAQAQFLKILSREAAIAAFEAALAPRPLGVETVALDALAGRVLAEEARAVHDAPPFDRSGVDGFAVRAEDLREAAPGRPVRLLLNAEQLGCGHAPRLAVGPGTATPIATGGMLPRGADAVVMIEHTEPDGADGIAVLRPLAAGQHVAFAGSDIALGQVMLRRGKVVGPREIAMLAAGGMGSARVWRRPRVAVLSTGDELVPAGRALEPAQIPDSNGPIVIAALREIGCEPVPFGIVADEMSALREALRRAHAECDAVVLSGGTSKGAGDLTHRAVGELGAPGIVAHGVALKPGKPLCLAVCDGKPVVVLPGFPTSAMFTFHDIVAPFFRRMAGLPPRGEGEIEARLAQNLASEAGRTEFAMVALARDADGLVAHPIGKGSGAVTAFTEADGFVAIDARSDGIAAGTRVPVRLFNAEPDLPDLVIAGSHCLGLDAVIGRLAERGITARVLALGSAGGLSALRRGEADLAPIHLFDPASGRYNRPFLADDMVLLPGWRRMQGLVFRPGDARFEGKSPEAAVAAALADAECLLVNRNSGAGTRALIDGLLKGARPPGYWNQPRSHNAVAASVAQGRADWGVAIRPAAEAMGLGFLPLATEHYDFALAQAPRAPAAIEAFRAALAESAADLAALGFSAAT